MKNIWTALALCGACVSGAHAAGEIYTGLGTHGVVLGYAHPLSSSFTVRVDVGTLGTHEANEREEGLDYAVKLNTGRAGVFGDWYPFEGGFRLTGGVTFNNFKLDMLARGNGGPMTIGGNTLPTTDSSDRLNVKVEFPKTTPYIGIGWGHQLGSGWGFAFDFGASIGKAKVTETHSGTNFGSVSQADIDRELAELREGVGKIKAWPLLSIGLNYQF